MASISSTNLRPRDNFPRVHRQRLTAGRKARARENKMFEVGPKWTYPSSKTKWPGEAYMSPTTGASLAAKIPRKARRRSDGLAKSLSSMSLHRAAKPWPICPNQPVVHAEGLRSSTEGRSKPSEPRPVDPSRELYRQEPVIGDLCKAPKDGKD